MRTERAWIRAGMAAIWGGEAKIKLYQSRDLVLVFSSSYTNTMLHFFSHSCISEESSVLGWLLWFNLKGAKIKVQVGLCSL